MNQSFKPLLRDFALRSNALADQGHHVLLDVVYDEIERGTIIEWLIRAGAGITGSLTLDDSPDRKAFINSLQKVAKHLRNREMSQLGLENNGFCLLTALTLELIMVTP